MAFSIISGPYRKDKNGEKFLKAVCQCGKKFELQWVKRKIRKSCGCLKSAGNRLKHGHCMKVTGEETSTYRSWRAMSGRCGNPNDKMFHRYGGRGIRVCERWKDFECFLADMPLKPEGATIDRIDSDKDYEPGNCRWATRADQNRNKSSNRMLTIYGKTMCTSEWCRISGVDQRTASTRLIRGWTHKEAIFGKPKD